MKIKKLKPDKIHSNRDNEIIKVANPEKGEITKTTLTTKINWAN